MYAREHPIPNVGGPSLRFKRIILPLSAFKGSNMYPDYLWFDITLEI